MVKFAKLFSTLLSATLFFSTLYAQSDKQRIDAYVNQYKELAINEMLRTGVPASITLAQGILETAGGQSDLASVANNHFGIKCKSEWTGETMFHDDDAKGECFRKYPSVEDSYRDHSDFLRNRPHYAFLFKLDPTDYEGWARGLKKAGYATSSTYATALIRMIVENNLQQYSISGLQRLDKRDDLFLTGTVGSAINSNAEENVESEIVTKPSPEFGHKAEIIKRRNTNYPSNSIFSINQSKVIYAEAGTSLLALANNYNVALKKLIEFNDLEESDILNANQLIFLEKKPKKGTKEIHIVEENETLHDIAQEEGIQLSTIMELNGLKKGMQPAAGERIYLKTAAPSSPKLALAGISKIAASM